MRRRILLIDGNSIMNRAFYAVIGRAPMTAPDGTPTGALNGFFATMLSVKDEYRPTDICVLFDLKAPTFRHKMYDDYKAQRKGMPPELSAQMPVIKELLDLMGVSRMELEGYEADDLIGTLSLMGQEDGDDVFILSGDHDDYQLISDSVSVIMPQSGKGKPPRILLDKNAFMEQYGISPDVFVDVKALMGDNSDNIKGVEKVGEKTALKLIADYGNIEGVINNSDKLSPSLKARIDESHDLLDLNMKLCRIDRNVPVPYGLDEISFEEIKDPQGLFDRLNSLGLRQVIKKLGLDGMKATFQAEESDDESPEGKLYSGFVSVMNDIRLISDRMPEIRKEDDIGLSFKGAGKVFVNISGGTDVYLTDPDTLTDIYERAGLEGACVTGFDYKNTSKILPRPLSGVDSVFDTSVCGYVFNYISGSEPDFKRLMESVFKRPYPIEDQKSGQMTIDFMLTGDDSSEDDDLDDAKRLVLNMKAAQVLKEKIKSEDCEKLLYEIEFPLVVTLDNIERNGMYVSGEKLFELHDEFSKRIGELEKEIYASTGYEFNIGSPKQLSDVLFEKLGLPHGKKGKTGVYSTSVEELKRLRAHHECIDLIISYRALTKLDSTYTLALEEKRDPDGRIRTTFTQAMTNTGRLSSTDPNLQNIPVRSSDGGRIRGCFTAPSGRILVDADYSQIELRLLAAMSGDEVMTDAFLNGEDIHKRTAMKVFGVSEDEVTSKQRSQAKTVNFSIIYGVSEFGLASDLGIPYDDAKTLISEYGKQFPRITGYLDSLKMTGEKLGYTQTLYGRKRILTELSSQNRNIKNFGYRAAMNTPIQGTAADIIKIAMNKVFRALKKELPSALLVMQVHDELIVECDIADREKAEEILKREMESAASFKVPLAVDVNSSDNWLDAK